jgi:xylulokinase
MAVRDAYSALPSLTGTIRLTGGGSRSPGWCQVLADVLEHDVETVEEEETGALGASIHAAVAVGWYPSRTAAVRAMVRTATRYDPRPEYAARYREWFSLYRDLYHSLVPFWSRRTAWLRGPRSHPGETLA